MLLKPADDKSKRLALLEELQRSSLLDARQKKWLREELFRQRKGIQGEKESAYFLDQHFKINENHVVLHDLRFVVDGDVAQIDHLVINRAIGIYLIETKNYAGNLIINDHGEFTVDYDGERFGIPSPIEQSKRHERVLTRLLSNLGISFRTGGPPPMHHVVMVHPKAIITRPDAKRFDTSNVIKADQFPSWHGQYVDKEAGLVNMVKLLANVRSSETIQEWGEKLKRQHRPANLLELPEFMRPRQKPDDHRRVAQAPTYTDPPVSPPTALVPVPAADNKTKDAQAIAKKLICAHCGSKISYPEGKFCWRDEKRFGGLQYCREHQGMF